ncbi:hypothetical protein [Erwinia oleae]|uniref:hypothetical protein n=1 Tax=Erwinia oleae TaxID=796334 RepID=UPI000550A877|nr:hypothetical protein [Erwinia oleae]
MDKRILQLGSALERAAQEENWSEIRRIDSRISQLLTTIRKQGLQEVLRDDLETLRKSHLKAATICQEQHDVLHLKIQQHQHSREGLQAYALFVNDREEGQ